MSTPRQPHRAVVAGCVAGALVVAAVVLALVAGDGDDPAARAGGSSSPSPSAVVTAPPTEEPDGPPPTGPASPTAAPTTDVRPATGEVLTAPEAGATLTLPERWAGAQLEDGAEAASRQVYPDDPAQAARTVAVLRNLPGSAILFGIDIEAAERGARFTPNLNLLVDGSVPAALGLGETAAAEVRGLRTAFAVVRQDSLDFGEVEMERITYRSPAQGFTGLAYVAKEQGVTYVLTYTFPELTGAARALADGSASTFSLS